MKAPQKPLTAAEKYRQLKAQTERAGQWSARKAQIMAKRYKAAGGGYRD